MKNVDVPMWDKGDDTDDFSKGGGSSSFGMPSSKLNDPAIKKTYKLVLGREPSSRETAYYKYSSLKKEEIVDKLLLSEEHKNILEKANTFPEVKDENKKAKSTILKLKSLMNDKESEFLEIKRLLVEKNKIIEDLRERRDSPFLTDKRLLEDDKTHYGLSKDRISKKERNFFDRLLYLLWGENE